MKALMLDTTKKSELVEGLIWAAALNNTNLANRATAFLLLLDLYEDNEQMTDMATRLSRVFVEEKLRELEDRRLVEKLQNAKNFQRPGEAIS